MIRMFVKDVSVIGRNTAGVRLMKLEEGERVVAIEKVAGEEGEGKEAAKPSEKADSKKDGKKKDGSFPPIIIA
jgi:DNA gyrase subunit A